MNNLSLPSGLADWDFYIIKMNWKTDKSTFIKLIYIKILTCEFKN